MAECKLFLKKKRNKAKYTERGNNPRQRNRARLSEATRPCETKETIKFCKENFKIWQKRRFRGVLCVERKIVYGRFKSKIE